MLIVLFVFIILVIVVYAFMKQARFGRLPYGERKERIRSSAHYKEGKFQNQSATPDLTDGATYYSVMKEFFFNKNKMVKPPVALPAVKIDLHNISPDANLLVWFGHSSYFMQVDGKRILVDPVLSGSASPISFTTRSFPGADVYSAADIPAIDYLFISHDLGIIWITKHCGNLNREPVKSLQGWERVHTWRDGVFRLIN